MILVSRYICVSWNKHLDSIYGIVNTREGSSGCGLFLCAAPERNPPPRLLLLLFRPPFPALYRPQPMEAVSQFIVIPLLLASLLVPYHSLQDLLMFSASLSAHGRNVAIGSSSSQPSSSTTSIHSSILAD